MSPDEPKPPSRTRISGIERTIQILDELCERGEAASTYDIAKSIGAPVSTIYAIIPNLIACGMLSHAENNLIWLGPTLFRYGLAYESNIDLLTKTKDEMKRLSREIGETVQICCRDEGMMVVVAMADGNDYFRVSSDVGTRVPLNWTASGRLLLGHLSNEQRLDAFRLYSKPSPTGFAETDATKLAEQAGRDFSSRLAIQLGASEFSIACIASPVCNPQGHCAATISIVLPEKKAKENLERYGTAVKKSASNIEQALGRHTT